MESLTTETFDKVTTSIVFDDRRAKKAKPSAMNNEDRYPVRYRVFYNKVRVFYGSGIDLTVDQWNVLSHTKSKVLIETRKRIFQGFKRINEHVDYLVQNGNFTIDKLNSLLNKGRKDSIISAFYAKIENLRREGRIGNSIMYSCAVKSIEKFTKTDLKFAEVTKEWLNKYQDHLKDSGRSFNTISMYMRTLRAVVNEAKAQGIINAAQYAFGRGQYEIPIGEGRKLALTLAQIKEVVNYPLPEKDQQFRDLWFFSYLCNGLNINDLLKLRFSNIVDGEIEFYRSKTLRTQTKKRRINAIILPEMQRIIERWGNPDHSEDNFIFPFLKDGVTPIEEKKIIQNVTRMINERMYRIGNALGYGKISTYCARHSYATILKRSGANIAYISESLGHSDLKTTQSYLDSFEKEERQKNAEILTKF